MNPKGYELTEEQEKNQEDLHKAINVVRKAYGKAMYVTSGVRDMQHHKNIYLIQGWKEVDIPMGSAHLIGLGIDVADTDGKLWAWCLDNLKLLQEQGLYLEDVRWTRSAKSGWVHFQLRAPASGKRIFIPSSQPATDPDFWDGKYSKEFDQPA
jgi:hypothetical protein